MTDTLLDSHLDYFTQSSLPMTEVRCHILNLIFLIVLSLPMTETLQDSHLDFLLVVLESLHHHEGGLHLSGQA